MMPESLPTREEIAEILIVENWIYQGLRGEALIEKIQMFVDARLRPTFDRMEDAHIAADAVVQATLTREKQLISDARIAADEYRKLWYENDTLRADWFKEAEKAYKEAENLQANLHQSQDMKAALQERLARKDEALRACVEALEDIASTDESNCSIHDSMGDMMRIARAVLTRPGVKEIQ